MPRNAKRQAPAAPGDQAYGEAGAQLAAQEQMPLPDMKAPPAAGGPAGPPAADPLAAAMSMEAPAPPPWAAGPMDEQITAGLPTGPGPGPEALGPVARPRAPIAEMLLRLADATGDDYYAELAQSAQQQGR